MANSEFKGILKPQQDEALAAFDEAKNVTAKDMIDKSQHDDIAFLKLINLHDFYSPAQAAQFQLELKKYIAGLKTEANPKPRQTVWRAYGYMTGTGVEMDLKMAKLLFEMVKEQDSLARYFLVLMSEKDEGVVFEAQDAVRLYEEAKNPLAECQAARWYHLVYGIRNYELAKKCYQSAIDAGHPYACWELANEHMKDNSLLFDKPSPEESIKLLTRAAKLGMTDALARLGYILITQNRDEASGRKYLHTAAASHNSTAFIYLAELWAKNKDIVKSAQCTRLAVECAHDGDKKYEAINALLREIYHNQYSEEEEFAVLYHIFAMGIEGGYHFKGRYDTLYGLAQTKPALLDQQLNQEPNIWQALKIVVKIHAGWEFVQRHQPEMDATQAAIMQDSKVNQDIALLILSYLPIYTLMGLCPSYYVGLPTSKKAITTAKRGHAYLEQGDHEHAYPLCLEAAKKGVMDAVNDLITITNSSAIVHRDLMTANLLLPDYQPLKTLKIFVKEFNRQTTRWVKGLGFLKKKEIPGPLKNIDFKIVPTPENIEQLKQDIVKKIRAFQAGSPERCQAFFNNQAPAIDQQKPFTLEMLNLLLEQINLSEQSSRGLRYAAGR